MVGNAVDGFPPDRKNEQRIDVAVGQVIRRRNSGKRGKSAFDFIKIVEIVPPNDRGRKAQAKFQRLDKKTGEWEPIETEISVRALETMEFRNSPDKDPKYRLVSQTEEEFRSSEDFTSLFVSEESDAKDVSQETNDEAVEPEDTIETFLREKPLSPEEIQERKTSAENDLKRARKLFEREEDLENRLESNEDEVRDDGPQVTAPESLQEQATESEREKGEEKGDEELNAPSENVSEGEKSVKENPSEQREVLEKRLEEARLQYLQDDYDHSTKHNLISRIIGRKLKEPVPEFDALSLREYKEALKNLRDFEFEEVKGSFAGKSQEEKDKSIEMFLLRYRYEEAADLYEMGKEVKFRAENEKWSGKALNYIRELGNGYRKMSWQKKAALTAGVIGLGAFAGSVGTGAAAVASLAYAVKRAIAGTAGFMAVDEGVNKFFENRDAKNAAEEAETLRNEVGLDLNKLLALTQDKIDSVDKDLDKNKKRENKVKLAAFAAAIGLPAAVGSIDFFGGDEGGVDKKVTHHNGENENLKTLSPSENGETPQPENSNTPESETETSSAGPVQEVNAEIAGLQAVTINETHQKEGLWGIVQNQLPVDMSEAEKNRVAASVQNLIQNKVNLLTPEEVQKQYGFSSKNIGLVYPGEVIQLGKLVSQEELEAIVNGRVVMPDEILSNISPTEGMPSSEQVSDTGQGVSSHTEVQNNTNDSFTGEKKGYINSETIGFGPVNEPEPLKPIADLGGRTEYMDRDRFQREILDGDLEPHVENVPYTMEMSDYRSLLQDPIAENVDVKAKQAESFRLIQDELWDIDNSRLGPDHQFTNMNKTIIENQYGNRPMAEIVAFDDPRYNRDPRFRYNERMWAIRQGRGKYLPPMHPYPRLDSGPDAYAIAEMDFIRNEYRQNLSSFAESSIRAFGSVALPISTPEYRESMREYMARIATLYTRARIENPNFRIKI